LVSFRASPLAEELAHQRNKERGRQIASNLTRLLLVATFDSMGSWDDGWLGAQSLAVLLLLLLMIDRGGRYIYYYYYKQ